MRKHCINIMYYHTVNVICGTIQPCRKSYAINSGPVDKPSLNHKKALVYATYTKRFF